MRLTFLGKDTQGGNSPTLWETDDGQYVILGFTLDAEAMGQVGGVPDGEAVIRVPKELMRYEDFKALVVACKRAFHLEQRDTYNVAAEDEPFGRWLRAEPDDYA